MKIDTRINAVINAEKKMINNLTFSLLPDDTFLLSFFTM